MTSESDEKLRQRIQALEAEVRGLRNEIKRLRTGHDTTALIPKDKASK